MAPNISALGACILTKHLLPLELPRYPPLTLSSVATGIHPGVQPFPVEVLQAGLSGNKVNFTVVTSDFAPFRYCSVTILAVGCKLTVARGFQ